MTAVYQPDSTWARKGLLAPWSLPLDFRPFFCDPRRNLGEAFPHVRPLQRVFHLLENMSNQRPSAREMRQWFIRGDGIERAVISADVQRYLGNDATVRPGFGTDPEVKVWKANIPRVRTSTYCLSGRRGLLGQGVSQFHKCMRNKPVIPRSSC